MTSIYRFLNIHTRRETNLCLLKRFYFSRRQRKLIREPLSWLSSQFWTCVVCYWVLTLWCIAYIFIQLVTMTTVSIHAIVTSVASVKLPDRNTNPTRIRADTLYGTAYVHSYNASNNSFRSKTQPHRQCTNGAMVKVYVNSRLHLANETYAISRQRSLTSIPHFFILTIKKLEFLQHLRYIFVLEQ